MIYDHNNTINIQELQVVAATSMVHRSLDNEITLTAQNLRLQNIVQNLNEELARVRNTDVAGLNVQLSQLQQQLNTALHEREEVQQQFATVKQREGTLKTELRELRESSKKQDELIAELEAERDVLRSSSGKKPASKKAHAKTPAAPSKS